MLTIAQITDIHLTALEDESAANLSHKRLHQVLRSIDRLRPRPIAILATGDLVENGTAAEYQALRAILAKVDLPIYFAVGNHDNRGAFLDVFAGAFARTDSGGFVQYSMEFEDLRLVVCDTLADGGHESGFCDRRAAWLAGALDQAPERPTLVAMHHPPVASGIRWMDPDPQAPWIRRAEEALRGRDQVRAVICGHLHRAFTTVFAGHPLLVAPATWMQLSLDLTPVDVRIADGRELLAAEPPGYLLHLWERGQLTSHVAVAGRYSPVANYDKPFQPS